MSFRFEAKVRKLVGTNQFQVKSTKMGTRRKLVTLVLYSTIVISGLLYIDSNTLLSDGYVRKSTARLLRQRYVRKNQRQEVMRKK